MPPQQFQIRVEDSVLVDLHDRLRRTRWLAASRDDEWTSGTSTTYLKDLVTYWLHGYDWRRHEARLNEFPQFKADVNGAPLHFIHQRAERTNALPLLLLHGWPDSFYRFYKVIPLLAQPEVNGGNADDAVNVVVPSLPGFGFTGAVARARASAHQPNRQTADLLWRLMTDVLGYERFVVAGGDGGGALAQLIAIDHPESVVGIHLTDLGWHVANVDPSSVSKEEKEYLDGAKKAFMADGAYAMVHATKPNSLAPALNDSPAALAAWIVDRFHSWCDCDGDVGQSFTMDEILTNIMIYWVSATIGSSMKAYYDDAVSPSLTTADHVAVPVALALFPKEPGGIPPQRFAARTLNVKRWSEMPRGGHFTAFEEPELYARDVVAFLRELRTMSKPAGQGGNRVSATL
ncbi:MAG: epoxide hydrolase family protein [bacterium]